MAEATVSISAVNSIISYLEACFFKTSLDKIEFIEALGLTQT